MKKATYILLLLSFLAFSCKKDKDFLTITPLDTYSDAAVWKDPSLIAAYVNNMYQNIFAYPYCIAPFATFVDEAQFLNDWGASDFNKCNITPDGLAGWDVDWTMPHTRAFLWDRMFIAVQESNVFMANIKNAPASDIALTNRMKGEVYFIRAFAYHYLTSFYGGVPIIENVNSLDTASYYVPRNSYDECINYISSQLDSAANLLPLVQSGGNIGRATKGAALALKSRVLLYAASDLHNTTSYAPGYSHPELIGYTTGTKADRWLKAKNAAKAVIDLGIYSLVNPDPAPTADISANIQNYFLTKNMTSEDILFQQFIPEYVTKLSWDEYPPNLTWASGGYGGWGCPGPLGTFVDSYEMKDGSQFSWDITAEAANPYANRDARMAATILYEGAPWMQRPTGNKSYDPFNQMQCGVVLNENSALVIGGADSKVGPTGGNNSNSNTGYYLCKFLDPTVVPSSSTAQGIPFRHFRYAEVLLNYAEASIELGQDAEAQQYINMVRTRAGQPAVTETGDALRQRYRNERKVELSFENHRFFDVRRWLIGSEAYKPVSGVKITYSVNSSDNVKIYRKADGSYWSAPTYSPIIIEQREWKDLAYFFPIYRTEMNKNPKLIQNPGYN
jgi:hypothetical protein